MANGIKLDELTISQVHEAYKNGDYTCSELVQAYLDRIEAIDKNGPTLGAVLAISKTALEEGDALDKHFKSTSAFVGPLHGIPVLLKDQAETKGLATTYGSIVARNSNNVPMEDSTVVQKLKAGGAVILGKTTMPDWATSWFSISSIPPYLTKNPYALNRDTGGSSSGTGAAITSNMALIGLGEDTGGSIRVPSSFCGLVGLRATPGMISRKGLSPLLVPQGTPGPMCRTVTDAALMFDAMVGYDEADAYTATFVLAGRPEGGSYAANLTSDTMRRARLGVLRVQMLGADSDPDCAAVNAVINRALDTLASSGTQLVDIEIPDMEKSLFFTLIYGSRSRYDLDNFLSQRPHIKPNTMAEIQASGLYHKGLDLINTIAQSPVHPHQDPEYHLRMEERDKFQKQLIGILAKHQLDAFVFPDCKIAAPKLADILKPKWGLMDFPINTTLASNGWMPAITVPAGLTEGENLPVGLEMVGLPYQEQKLFQLAFGVEELVKGRKPPAL